MGDKEDDGRVEEEKEQEEGKTSGMELLSYREEDYGFISDAGYSRCKGRR